MGIKKIIKNYEESTIKQVGKKYSGLVWCEYGNQDYENKPAKENYENNGVNHTSIDLNGKHGSLPLDLGSPITVFDDKFDVITNYGTSEHINNQYYAFKNMHDMCKINGLMIHVVPAINNWKDHCRYYYSVDFFEELAKKCNYKIIDLKILNEDYAVYPKNLVIAVYIKEVSGAFIQEDEFRLLKGIKDSGDLKNTQNYTK